jgi:hypothetical protein
MSADAHSMSRSEAAAALLALLDAPCGMVNVSGSPGACGKGMLVVESAPGTRLVQQPGTFAGYEVVYRARKAARPLQAAEA